MAYPPEFLKLVDEFIHLANRLAETGNDGEVSAAILLVSNLEGVVGPVVASQD